MATSFAYVALTVGVSIRAYKTYYLGFHDKVCQSLIQRKKTGKLVASWSVTSTGLWASTEGRMWLCPGRAEKASRRWPFLSGAPTRQCEFAKETACAKALR